MSGVEEYELRPACVGDADVLGRLHVEIWKQTYAGLMSQEALATLDVDERIAMWRSLLATADAPSTWVALAPGSQDVIGWITVGPGRDADAPVSQELLMLNVVAEHQGRGAARRLMEAGLGDAEAYLWVVEGNARAVGFYEKHGFALDGAVRNEDEGNRDLRMVRRRRC